MSAPKITKALPETQDRAGRVINVGSRVRSYDFADGEFGRDSEGERACYAEGVVEGVCENFFDCPRYAIRVERRMFGGKERPALNVGEHVFPPLNGTPSWTGQKCDGVEVLEDVGEA